MTNASPVNDTKKTMSLESINPRVAFRIWAPKLMYSTTGAMTFGRNTMNLSTIRKNMDRNRAMTNEMI